MTTTGLLGWLSSLGGKSKSSCLTHFFAVYPLRAMHPGRTGTAHAKLVSGPPCFCWHQIFWSTSSLLLLDCSRTYSIKLKDYSEPTKSLSSFLITSLSNGSISSYTENCPTTPDTLLDHSTCKVGFLSLWPMAFIHKVLAFSILFRLAATLSNCVSPNQLEPDVPRNGGGDWESLLWFSVYSALGLGNIFTTS